MIKLFYAKYDESPNGNFGDELSPIIVSEITGQKVEYAVPGKCDLIAVGSILDIFGVRKVKKIPRLFRRTSPVHVWGSGLMYDEKIIFPRYIKFCAVRGEKTQLYLPTKHHENLAIGDPALLLSLLYDQHVDKTIKIGIIPHYIDQCSPLVKQLHHELPSSRIIDLLAPSHTVINEIRSCHIVISSSLHALITADSYGIPNIWVEFSNNILGNKFKYYDYFSSIDRCKETCFDQRKKLLSQKEISTRLESHNAPNIKTNQNNLISAINKTF